MARRSLQASPDGIKRIKEARKAKGWTLEYLAGSVGCSRQTISSLLQGNPIDEDFFLKICSQLNLDSLKITQAVPLTPTENQENTANIDALVQEVRDKVRPSIIERCGTMRVLDMTQPIGIGDIYTNVNILEKITGRQRKEIAELLKHCNLEEFDRFELGIIKEERVPGLEAVERYSKLMVLGKPGAGKTTFLKYLAIQCINGEFQSERVPIFITLKHFAETKNSPELLDFISKELAKEAVTDTQIVELLNNGMILLLLDGLDEVKEDNGKRVIMQIQHLSEQYRTNQFVITCRIAAREYTFEQFTEVEVADFDDKLIETFVNKWFKIKNLNDLAERFLKALSSNQPIKELATNPLLLTLLCLEFEDSGDFPANRSELYKRGTDTLLRKWDKKRGIERDEVYKNLSVQRKEDLLSQVAFTTFERGDYFFKQKEVEKNISDYIRNLPDADPKKLEVDSEAVLKSIEAQHGLMVERAKGIYSFSHLTFQEYFTAREIINSPDLEKALKTLVSHITEKRWREVFLLTAGILRSADQLLKFMKQQVDTIVADDEQLQKFLVWINEKTLSVNVTYKLAAVRAFYWASARDLDLNLDLDLDLALALALDLDLDRARARALDLALDLDRDLDRDRARALDLDLDLNLDLDRALDRALALALARTLKRTLNRALARTLKRTLDRALARTLKRTLDRDLALDLDPQLKTWLQDLKSQLPNYEDEAVYEQWWEDNGKAWTEQFRTVLIQYRNIGHDWQFSYEQEKIFKQYYDANLLLVNCLNSDCYVSREVRQEIEDTLLLPMSEINNRTNKL